MPTLEVPAGALSFLLFVAGSTPCALPCHRVSKVTPLEEADDLRVLDIGRLGLGNPPALESSRLVWLSGEHGEARLPIVGACSLVEFASSEVLPLPQYYSRVTPFAALLRSETRTALLLDSSSLTDPSSAYEPVD